MYKTNKYNVPKEKGGGTTTTSASSNIYNNAGDVKFQSHTFWSQTFDGTNDVKGDMREVGNLQMSGKLDNKGGMITSGNIVLSGTNTIQIEEELYDVGGRAIGDEAYFNNIKAYKTIETNHLNALKGDIAELVSQLINTKKLIAQEANIDDITAQEITTDRLTVTGTAHFFELIIDKIKSAGGSVLFTPADGFAIDRVYEYGDSYMICWKNNDGEKKRDNMWMVGDQALCQTFNKAQVGTSHNVSNKYYWSLVVDCGEIYIDENYPPIGIPPMISIDDSLVKNYNYIKVSKTDMVGKLDPEIGDEVVMLGHRYSNTIDQYYRQSAVYIAAYNSIDRELRAPLFCQYKGINDFNLSSHKYIWFAGNGSTVRGNVLLENGTTIENYVEQNKPYIKDGYWWIGDENTGVKADGGTSEPTYKIIPIKQDNLYDADNDTLGIDYQYQVFKINGKTSEIVDLEKEGMMLRLYASTEFDDHPITPEEPIKPVDPPVIDTNAKWVTKRAECDFQETSELTMNWYRAFINGGYRTKILNCKEILTDINPNSSTFGQELPLTSIPIWNNCIIYDGDAERFKARPEDVPCYKADAFDYFNREASVIGPDGLTTSYGVYVFNEPINVNDDGRSSYYFAFSKGESFKGNQPQEGDISYMEVFPNGVMPTSLNIDYESVEGIETRASKNIMPSTSNPHKEAYNTDLSPIYDYVYTGGTICSFFNKAVQSSYSTTTDNKVMRMVAELYKNEYAAHLVPIDRLTNEMQLSARASLTITDKIRAKVIEQVLDYTDAEYVQMMQRYSELLIKLGEITLTTSSIKEFIGSSSSEFASLKEQIASITITPTQITSIVKETLNDKTVKETIIQQTTDAVLLKAGDTFIKVGDKIYLNGNTEVTGMIVVNDGQGLVLKGDESNTYVTAQSIGTYPDFIDSTSAKSKDYPSTVMSDVGVNTNGHFINKATFRFDLGHLPSGSLLKITNFRLQFEDENGTISTPSVVGGYNHWLTMQQQFIVNESGTPDNKWIYDTPYPIQPPAYSYEVIVPREGNVVLWYYVSCISTDFHQKMRLTVTLSKPESNAVNIIGNDGFSLRFPTNAYYFINKDIYEFSYGTRSTYRVTSNDGLCHTSWNEPTNNGDTMGRGIINDLQSFSRKFVSTLNGNGRYYAKQNDDVIVYYGDIGTGGDSDIYLNTSLPKGKTITIKNASQYYVYVTSSTNGLMARDSRTTTNSIRMGVGVKTFINTGSHWLEI